MIGGDCTNCWKPKEEHFYGQTYCSMKSDNNDRYSPLVALTVNQLILLLEAHRGTLDESVRCGTRSIDMRRLIHANLIDTDHELRIGTTSKGSELVERLLQAA